MGSKVYAKKAKREKERIDGMICLEMVGLHVSSARAARVILFPLMFMGYPKKGNFIGIVGNLSSTGFTNSLYKAFKKNQ